ncbi:MAG TPA: glyoxalase [Stackebrandtia sp.]|jgi:catechol 2,3-dioxygenase-like lactoylglutathione lyase family enzyme|uniref:glyoxalase n=1 Tax=Stackebrandtia sp. TaxID=2023065 RepID=UPI002D56E730|nr:glyoxalase [Stackebrandtia sp.]HZE41415.1 glyoxalase [Stackebrandtia sp.]
MPYVIHHIQIACPAGSEDTLRAFYADVLGLVEQPKPANLAARGGCWFRGPGEGHIEFHLGVEADFAPARKAHPGVVWGDEEALRDLASRLEAAGHPVAWDGELHDVPMRLNGTPDAPVNTGGMWRFYTADPHGNRMEFLAPRTV